MDTDAAPIPQNAGPVLPPHTDMARAALKARHETTDIHVTGIFIFAAGLLLTLFIFLAGLVVFFKTTGVLDRFLDKRRAQGEPGSNSLVRVQPDYQGPLLQIRPEQDLHHMQQANAVDLRTYGWTDRRQGIVHVPIDHAMDLIAQRGLPPVSPGLTVEQIQQQRADPQVYGQNLRP